ncbi:MAG: MBL fold metallo-hydrolase [Candidatus Nanohaloarchaea archaeon]
MKVYTLGGYEEVGMNMTAVEVDGDVVIFDMGYNMEEVIGAEGQVDEMTTNQSLDVGAIPKDKPVLDKNVVGIVIGHGHLDHVGAIPKLAGSHDCPIYCSPYTKKIVEGMIEDDRKNVNNPVIGLEIGEEADLTDDFTLEFAHVNHSIPDATMSLLNTPEGYVVYGNDMKIDRSPAIADTTDIDRLKEAGKEGVKVMIPGTTRVDEDGRARSEESVKVELEDILNSCYDAGGAVVLSTFSSQIGRLKSVLDANDGRRKVAFVGRSLKEYVESAEELGLIDTSDIEIVSYYDEVEELMSRVNNEKEEWLIVATGNQGEPGAQLTKMANQQYPFRFEKGDHVVFSSEVIPTPVNRANRHELEKELKDQSVRMYKGIHTTGHALKEDHRDFIQFLDPENIVPSHGDIKKLGSYVELAREEGYSLEKDVFIGENGRIIDLD